MTNEEKLRETFPNTIFIFRKNRNDETAAIMVSDEWLQGDYDQMYKDAEPCEDCVSREAVLDALVTCFDTDSVYDENNGTNYIDYDDAVNEVLDLPPVTPKPKTGKWIHQGHEGEWRAAVGECSACGREHIFGLAYCPCCGVKMKGANK